MTRLIIALSLMFAATAAYPTNPKPLVDAQIDSTLTSNKVVFIDGTPHESVHQQYVDSVRRVIAAFYYDQFKHFSDPGAPYFLFMSKDASLAMGIGGAVRMRGYYDWGGAVPAPAFAPYLIPITPDPTNIRHLGSTPAGTCLYFRVIGRNKLLGNYQLYIEGNFTGYESRDFKLKKAYAIINDFTIGYAASTFSDPAALPPMVDSNGPNNKISPTSVLIRYMPVVRDRWYFAVSAETPETAAAESAQNTRTVSNFVPDFAAFAQYQWAQGQHIRLSGIYRNMGYRDLTAGRNYNVGGWGLQLSSVGHVTPQLTYYLTANYGRGYAGLGGDLLMGRYDLVGDPTTPGKLYAPYSLGWNVGLQYNFLPNLFAVVTTSQTRYLPSHQVSPSDYKYGVMAAANIFWNLTPRITAAAEFDLGLRRNFSGEHRYARRIGAMCQFSF